MNGQTTTNAAAAAEIGIILIVIVVIIIDDSFHGEAVAAAGVIVVIAKLPHVAECIVARLVVALVGLVCKKRIRTFEQLLHFFSTSGRETTQFRRKSRVLACLTR
jgi:hypothetical protein